MDNLGQLQAPVFASTPANTMNHSALHLPHPPTAVAPPPRFPATTHHLNSHAPAAPHPAFGLPMGLPSFLPGTFPFTAAQLHQIMTADGGFVAQYLNSFDPLTRATLMEITKMGHYPLGKKLFGCPQCRYITDRKNNLKRHVATMHQDCDKVLECCGALFKNKAALREHVLIFHSNGYMCRFCGRNFCRKALLKRHLTVHSGQKDFTCEHCDYATSHKSNLERHRKVHERQDDDASDDNDVDDSGEHRESPTAAGFPKPAQTLYSASNCFTARAMAQAHMTSQLHASPAQAGQHASGAADMFAAGKHQQQQQQPHLQQNNSHQQHISSPSFSIDRMFLNRPHRSGAGACAATPTSGAECSSGAASLMEEEFDLGNVPINVVDV